MRIEKLKGTIKDYDWGNCDYIPSLVGGYDGKPQAELWFGTHPSGPSTLEDGTSLETALKEDRSLLGEEAYLKYNGKLPILYKVIAIAHPLSLQCHPDKRQAEDGWRREAVLRQAGLEHDYQDDNQKAEILAALTPVTAMCGFRELEAVKEDFSALLPVTYGKFFSSVIGSVKELFLGLYGLDLEERAEVLSELRLSLSSSDEPDWKEGFLTRKGIASICLDRYKGDIGALFPYILNVLNLAPGEALFLKPGTLHAYVYGNGVELMDASDNVLRGGLTTKRVDLAELERIMSFDAVDVKTVPKSTGEDGLVSFPVEDTSFLLLSAPKGSYEVRSRALRLCLVIDGSVTFTFDDSQVALGKGECAVISAESGEYAMVVTGSAYFAEVVT